MKSEKANIYVTFALSAIEIGSLYKEWLSGLINGRIFFEQTGIKIAASVGTFYGSKAGSFVGGCIGSFFPPLGPIIGTIGGAVVGGVVSYLVIDKIL